MKGYIISVVAAAIVCSAARTILSNKTAPGRILRMLCGVVMTVTVLSPLSKLSFDRVSVYFDDISLASSAYVSEGERAAQESISAVIKQQAEAYILDKATRMGLSVSVEVELDDGNNPVPCGVTVNGAMSPYAREQMREYIEDTLGISKENQKWT